MGSKTLGAVLALGAIGMLRAQTSTASPKTAEASAKPETYTGCVSKIPHVEDAYVISVEDRCLLLSGTFKAADLLNKNVLLRGLVIDATGRLPATLRVQSTMEVKGSCTKVCTLPPPGTRSLHGSEKPGREGGTPGVTPSPHSERPQ